MSDQMTGIRLRPTKESGISEYGRKTVPEMVTKLRAYAQHQKDWAEQILAARDEDFHVTTYVGVHVQRNREVLQEGLPRS